MKFVFRLTIIGIIVTTMCFAQTVSFEQYFTDQTMRIDYFHIGDATNELVTIDQIYQYGIWAGSKTNLVDMFNNGKYYFKIYDSASGNLIYSKGFGSYFGEYQTSAKAADGIQRTFHESALLPYPKQKIIFVLEKRNRQNELAEIFRSEIDPVDVGIIRDSVIDNSVKVFKSLESGDPHTKLDIAMIAEGYTVEEEEKFKADLERFTNVFFRAEPYKSHKSDFNIYGVLKPSQESGIDEPRHNSFKNSTLNATFNSMGSERYLLTEDNKTLRDVAAHVPYDALYIMVNHTRYGGGGIYNLYCTFTSDNQWSEYLFVHEFGHSLLGLADEYYTSSVAYNDFYPPGVEPVEPNITALLDPKNIKWKHLITEEIELPTPWEKEGYDTSDNAWQQLRRELNNNIAELKRNGAPQAEITAAEKTYADKDRAHTEKIQDYLKSSKYAGKVGAFEGAGYASKGLYRPMVDCIMFSKGTDSFCKVCEESIVGIIEYYSN